MRDCCSSWMKLIMYLSIPSNRRLSMIPPILSCWGMDCEDYAPNCSNMATSPPRQKEEVVMKKLLRVWLVVCLAVLVLSTVALGAEAFAVADRVGQPGER